MTTVLGIKQQCAINWLVANVIHAFYRWMWSVQIWQNFPIFLMLYRKNTSFIQDRCSTSHLAAGTMSGPLTLVSQSVFGGADNYNKGDGEDNH